MEPQPFVLERVFDAPAANVWKAITEVDYLRQWYFNIPDFKAKVGFEFTFESGGSCTQGKIHLCKVTEVVVGKKLAAGMEKKDFAGGWTYYIGTALKEMLESIAQ